MVWPIPTPGDDVSEVLFNSELIGALLHMLNAYERGAFQLPETGGEIEGRLVLENTSGDDFVAGEVGQLGSLAALPSGTDDDDAIAWDYHESPNLPVAAPTWHTSIDNLVAIQSDTPAGEFYEHGNRWFGTVLATQTNAGDRFVMIDPANPKRMKTADAGIWQILAYDGHGRCLVDFRRSQPLWRYKLNEASQAPGTTSAQLYRIDGDQFSASAINLSDPLNIGSNDPTSFEGYCAQVGNEFHIAPGPC